MRGPKKSRNPIGLGAEGLAICHAIKAELPDWTVVYHDIITGAVQEIDDPRRPELGTAS